MFFGILNKAPYYNVNIQVCNPSFYEMKSFDYAHSDAALLCTKLLEVRTSLISTQGAALNI